MPNMPDSSYYIQIQKGEMPYARKKAWERQKERTSS